MSEPIVCNETRVEFDSISNAARQLGIDRKKIQRHLDGLSLSVNGYTFSRVYRKFPSRVVQSNLADLRRNISYLEDVGETESTIEIKIVELLMLFEELEKLQTKLSYYE